MSTYRVGNPRGLPQGRHILAVRRTKGGKITESRWYEGDSIKRSDAFSDEGWQRLLRDGFVVKESGDGG